MNHQPGEVLGAPHPDWPADLMTFAERHAYQRGVADARHVDAKPIDMVLFCPQCGTQHIDAPSPPPHACEDDIWTNPPHRSHLCHHCGHIWRPADVPTNGVAAVATKGQNDSPLVTPTSIRQAGRLDRAYELEVTLRVPSLLDYWLSAEQDDEESNWYLRISGPDGCYVYDGFWQGSAGKSHDEVVQEAIRGACLVGVAG